MDKLIFNVDFNEMHDDGLRVIGSRREGRVSSFRKPEPGEEVWLEDDEKNGCPGIIFEVRDRTVLIEPLWDRWMTAPHLMFSERPITFARPFVFGSRSPALSTS